MKGAVKSQPVSKLARLAVLEGDIRYYSCVSTFGISESALSQSGQEQIVDLAKKCNIKRM